MRISILSSGSKQNCFYIETETESILIDSGLSYPKLRLFMNEIGRTPENLKAVFITHEHSDHVRGLENLAKKHSLSVYMHPESYAASGFKLRFFMPLKADEAVHFESLSITPFPVSHDAAHTFGYLVKDRSGKTPFLASDLGKYDDYTLSMGRGCDCIAVESNHDLRVLGACRYPEELKRRIRSHKGHLSNDDAASFLESCITENTRNVLFLHLSDNANTPEHVKNNVEKKLKKLFPHVHFTVASRDNPLPLIEI